MEQKRDFDTWLGQFRNTIYGYGYYVNWDKVYDNFDKNANEWALLDGIAGVSNPEPAFRELMKEHPEVRKVLNVLFACRDTQLEVVHNDKRIFYSFGRTSNSIDDYVELMREMGLFTLLSRLPSVTAFILGVETGLDTNGRKNRGGKEMERYIRKALQKYGFKQVDAITQNTSNVFAEQVYLSALAKEFPELDLSSIANDKKADKRFDFVVKTKNGLYGCEVNFYAKGGSKLNETARSYKEIALASKGIDGFTFVWFTDGKGWDSAKRNLKETFLIMDHIYNIEEVDNGIMKKVFI